MWPAEQEWALSERSILDTPTFSQDGRAVDDKRQQKTVQVETNGS